MSRVSLFHVAASALALTIAAPAIAQDSDEAPEWDVSNPPLPTRPVTIDVTEGTWMNVDVSPNGQTIAFDLLGDIYTMPITGGTPTRIASGLAWEVQPRFSPDGSRIAFTSDRGGGDNIWMMDANGSNMRQVTNENFRLLNQPDWSPDGQYIVARKHFTTGRSLGTGEVWLYHVSGGAGVRLVERPNENFQKDLGEPVFAPDGEGVYFSRNTTPGNQFIYAQDSNTQLFAVERYDMETGERETIVDGPGGALNPRPSPDGRYMAFIRRDRTQSVLYVKDLNSGEERAIYDALDRDMQETWTVYGTYPRMDWTPDSSSLVFWSGGHIRRVDVASGNADIIPFQISDTRDVIDPPRPEIEVAPTNFTTRMPRFASVSPDGRQVVFESLGRLHIRNMGSGSPRRLTSQSDAFELFPSWSRDGRRIVYVRWSDDGLGQIRVMNANGGGDRAVTSQPGHYRNPRFSPNGNMIVFEQGEGGFLTSGDWSERPGVYRVSANGGAAERITESGSNPHFGASGDRVFLTVSEENKQRLISVDLSGNDRRVHASGELVTGYEVSPDGDTLAFTENYNAFVVPMMPGTQDVELKADATSLPIVRVSGDGASYMSWSNNGDRLHWSLGPTLYSAAANTIFPTSPAAEGEERPDFVPPASGVSIAVSAQADRPSSRVALTGARIVTMQSEDGGIIENGTIVIDGDRIAAVGAADSTAIPAGYQTVDVAGATIIPGIIDAHAHGPHGVGDIIPQQNWHTIAHLAFGVTTVHDPSNTASHIFPAAEMQQAGLILAPRIFSTAEIVYGARAPSRYALINSLEDAQQHVRRLRVQGAHSIKNYNQPRREQRQQVVAAAIEQDIAVVAEGGSLFGMDMALIADGNTTLEHNIPQAVLYEDVLSFFGQTNVGYTPTLVVTYSGLAADPYWRAHTDVWRHPILSRHAPPRILQANSVRRPIAPEEDYVDDEAAAAAHALAQRGVPVSIGAHGQEEGLAAHWEMWSFVRGGMSPLEALRTATIVPAQALGFARDIGSLEAGKLADLVILDADPTVDIQNSDDIRYVMIGGRLYDPLTMNETITGNRTRDPYFWE
ncbi:amidohydrolase family protein [Parasphingopyxis sp. CP4]|uniref:amidohydrolase family protein n=1 Tax=Parasphingopyxis sp. CP4 TaxID=2724527 RepID=UPI0015A33CDF|nr:amidohydrolase family protein [Parasphingopyxis sp. CP4]QLC23171.1 amidohydrolase family protein [Parasphingopyxis sp. CP4]